MTLAAIEDVRTTQRSHRAPVALPETLSLFAHDVRGPLANLSLIIEGISDRNRSTGDPKVAAMLAKADQVIDRLAGMLDAMLERSRSHSAAKRGLRSIVALPAIIEQIAAQNEPLARKCNVRVKCLASKPLTIRGDAHLLMQALDNLITNAIKHSPPGGLVVCTAAQHADGVTIQVEDQGPGLTPDDIKHAFQPFVTLSAKSNAPLPSTGLGLTIVRQIARAHGGDVSVLSSPGKGAIFTLRLADQHAQTISQGALS